MFAPMYKHTYLFLIFSIMNKDVFASYLLENVYIFGYL